MTYFERIGQDKLVAVIDDFIDRCFADTMIGFMFARAERDRIKRFEYQHAAQFLGANIAYEGRPLDETHRPHRVLGGQFDRRRQILVETLNDHQIEPQIIDAWIAHQDSLRSKITKDVDSNCRD